MPRKFHVILLPQVYYDDYRYGLESHRLGVKWMREVETGKRIVFLYREKGRYLAEGALVTDKDGDPDFTIPGQRIYLSRVIVAPGERGRGIGSRMVEYLCHCARDWGYKEISVGVALNDAAGRALYKKKGFTTVIREGENKAGKYLKLLKTL